MDVLFCRKNTATSNTWFMGSADSKMKGRLLLEDGCEFEGIHFGANVTVPGEVGNIAILF